jgi:hypothetical protein
MKQFWIFQDLKLTFGAESPQTLLQNYRPTQTRVHQTLAAVSNQFSRIRLKTLMLIKRFQTFIQPRVMTTIMSLVEVKNDPNFNGFFRLRSNINLKTLCKVMDKESNFS